MPCAPSTRCRSRRPRPCDLEDPREAGNAAGLAGRDPRAKLGIERSRSLDADTDELRSLQDRLWAERRRSLLIVLQGADDIYNTTSADDEGRPGVALDPDRSTTTVAAQGTVLAGEVGAAGPVR